MIALFKEAGTRKFSGKQGFVAFGLDFGPGQSVTAGTESGWTSWLIRPCGTARGGCFLAFADAAEPLIRN